ncbi:16S rRNA methyltransferase [Candidatus Bathyarchaeota archaeon]|nr:16S rRNA methyltransferase [Candidatus Bathyarchaeota archaeon]
MAPKLTLVVAESALEVVPEALWGHPAIWKHAKREGKEPSQVLLDRSYHHSAMFKLEGAEKRGRPDIIHVTLLEALGSPLNKEGLLQIFVHTIGDYVIWVNPKVRIPRNYNRFVGLIEQLFEKGRVPVDGEPLLALKRQSLKQLFKVLNPTFIVAFSRLGERKSICEVTQQLIKRLRPLVLVGGFPRGHFADETIRLADEVVCVDPETLETWIIVSRVIYDYEQAINLTSKRLKIMSQPPTSIENIS